MAGMGSKDTPIQGARNRLCQNGRHVAYSMDRKMHAYQLSGLVVCLFFLSSCPVTAEEGAI